MLSFLCPSIHIANLFSSIRGVQKKTDAKAIEAPTEASGQVTATDEAHNDTEPKQTSNIDPSSRWGFTSSIWRGEGRSMGKGGG